MIIVVFCFLNSIHLKEVSERVALWYWVEEWINDGLLKKEFASNLRLN